MTGTGSRCLRKSKTQRSNTRICCTYRNVFLRLRPLLVQQALPLGELARVARLRGYNGAICPKTKSAPIASRFNSNDLMLWEHFIFALLSHPSTLSTANAVPLPLRGRMLYLLRSATDETKSLIAPARLMPSSSESTLSRRNALSGSASEEARTMTAKKTTAPLKSMVFLAKP